MAVALPTAPSGAIHHAGAKLSLAPDATFHDRPLLRLPSAGKTSDWKRTKQTQGWLNTDLVACDGVLFLNATKPLPFASGSFDYIFSEHMFEHVSFPEGREFLAEAYRVLKPGGRIRISTPDLAFLIRLYNESDTELMQRYIRNSIDAYVPDPKLYEPAVAINNFFYNWGHRFIYDFDAISAALLGVGFTDVTRCQVLESPDPHLRGLESHGRLIGEEWNLLESMAVEARKA